jgi:hypothetical protein
MCPFAIDNEKQQYTHYAKNMPRDFLDPCQEYAKNGEIND